MTDWWTDTYQDIIPFVMASCNQVSGWLPRHSGVGSTFVSLIRKARVGRLGFLRHGQTNSAVGGDDFQRQLTSLGQEQARSAGSSFGMKYSPFYRYMFVSPAPRTMETAKLFVESAGVEGVESVANRLLYDGTMQPSGSKLFRKIGYAPLRDYVVCDDENDRQIARNVLGSYAIDVTTLMMDTLEQDLAAKGIGHETTTLWMIGHAIYLPAVALHVASMVHVDDSDICTIVDSHVAETEGFIVDVEEKKVISLKT